MGRDRKRTGKIPLLLLILAISALLLPVMLCRADGTAVIVEVCTNESDLSVYVKNAGGSLTDVSAQIGTSPGGQVAYQDIGNLEFETLILIDNSLSIPKDMRSRTADFLEAFLEAKAPNEKIAVGVFSRNITYLTDFTSDAGVLKDAAASVSYQNQDTYITDMLYELLRDDYLGSRRDVYRRIVIIADGVDDESLGYTVDELRQLIREDTYPIYTIGCKTGSNDTELENLFSLSRQSQAEYFLMDSAEDISAIAEALGRDREIVKFVITPPEDLLDGSIKSVKINFSGQSVSREVRMPQQEMAVVVQTSEPETVVKESTVVESGESTEEETMAVEEETVRNAAAGEFILHCSAVMVKFLATWAWVEILAAFIILVVMLRGRKKKMEFEDAQNLMELRIQELKDALPSEVRIVLTDVHMPQKSFQTSLGSEVVAGRSRGNCGIVLDYDQSVSGRHCAIYMEKNKVMVRDLNSTNGTYVNGNRVMGQTELKQGDILVLGQLEMKVGIMDREGAAD